VSVIVEYLAYYKQDISANSLKMPKHDGDRRWRAGAISSIDAIVILLTASRKTEMYMNRIT